ncbi:uncharacterized protein JCM15063_006207 [Sporobolomyces koalae]|uniref:uncharacterized protein n=1 Tax=Sporobolomyces koalae TaxID=500713 RepID=UPI00316E5620
MGIPHLYDAIRDAKCSLLTTSLPAALYRIRQGELLPPPDQPAAPAQPLHFVDETSPYLVPILKAMQGHPGHRLLPPSEFNDLLQLKMEVKLRQVMQERERHAPGSFYTWIVEGRQRSNLKERTTLKRLEGSAESELKRDAIASRREKQAARKKAKSAAHNLRMRRKWKSDRMNEGDEEGTIEGREEGQEQREGEADRMREGEGEGEGEGTAAADETATARIIAEHEIEFPFRPEQLLRDPALHATRLQEPPSSHVRVITAVQEAESVLNFAATLTTHNTIDPRVRSVRHNHGAVPANFKHVAARTVSCLVDGDQFATADYAKIGWSLHTVSVGASTYKTHTLVASEHSPPTSDPDADAGQVNAYRLIETNRLIGGFKGEANTRVFAARTQEGIAGVVVLNGNDYSEGAENVGFAKLREAKHRDLVEFVSDMAEYQIASISNDKKPLAILESRFKKLLSNLPPSDFLRNLDLAAFYKLQQLTKGEYDSPSFDKPAFVKENLAVVKEEKTKSRIEARQAIAAQLDASRCQPSSRPANFALLPMRLWPQPVAPAEPEEGTPHDSMEVEGTREATPEAPRDDTALQANTSTRPSPLSFNGKPLPFHRKEVFGVADQIQDALARLDNDPLELGGAEPVPTKVVDTNDLDDAGARYTTIEHRVPQIYRNLKLSNGQPLPVPFKVAMYHLERGIATAGIEELAAVNRAFSLALYRMLETSPMSFLSLKLDHLDCVNKLLQIAGQRVILGGAQDRTQQSQGEWINLARAAVKVDQDRTKESYRAPNTGVRLESSISTLATSTVEYLKHKVKGLTAINDLVVAILSSPAPTLAKLEHMFATLFPARAQGHVPPFTLPRPTAGTTLLWIELSKAKQHDNNIIDNLVDYVLSERAQEWSPPEQREPPATPAGVLKLPDFPLRLQAAIQARFEGLAATVRSQDDPLVGIKQTDLEDASTVLVNAMRYVAMVLPQLLVAIVGQSQVDERVVPDMMRTTRAARGRPAIDPAAENEKTREFVGKLIDRNLPLREVVLNRGEQYKPKLFPLVQAFKLVVVALAGTIGHKYQPKAFMFAHKTSYFYATGAENATSGGDVKTPIFRALSNLWENETNAMARLEAQRDLLEQDEDRERREDALERDAEMSSASTGDRDDNRKRNNDHQALGRNPLTPAPFAAGYLAKLDRKVRLPAQDRSRRQHPGEEPKRARQFEGRRINGLHLLSPAERVASIQASYPSLKVSHALGSSCFFDVAKDQPLTGWVAFELNEQRLDKVCTAARTIFDAVLPGAGTRKARAEALMHLRPEVLNLIFKVARPGVLVPWTYTLTPTSLNILYRDPRTVDSLPPSADDYVSFVEKSLNKMYGKSLKLFRPTAVKEYASKLKVRKIPRAQRTNGRTKGFRLELEARLFRPIMSMSPGPGRRGLVWSAGRAKPQASRRMSARRPLDRRRVDLVYSNSDSTSAARDESLWFWNAPIWNADEKQRTEAGLAHDTRVFRELMSEDPLADPDTIVVYGANDRGIAYPAALFWFRPSTKEAFFDSFKKSRHAGAQRTRSRTQQALALIDGSNERDGYFRHLNEDLSTEQSKGAVKSIQERNDKNPDNQVSVNLGRSVIEIDFARQRSRADKRALERDVVVLVNSLFPVVDDKAYKVVFFDGADKLPVSSGRSGPTKDTAYMDALLACMNAREDITVHVFLVHEQYSSQTCCFCELPGTFHPVDFETGNEILRLTCCPTCREIFHRDEGAARLLLVGAIIGAKTGFHPFSPDHEARIFGRDIPPRAYDGHMRRPRKEDRALIAKHDELMWRTEQDLAFAKARLERTAEGTLERDNVERQVSHLEEELGRLVQGPKVPKRAEGEDVVDLTPAGGATP